MCVTAWETYLMAEPDWDLGNLSPYETDRGLMKQLGVDGDVHRWPCGATITTGRIGYHTMAQARARACALALNWAARYPEHAHRIVAAQVHWCHGTDIEEAITDPQQWAVHAAELAPEDPDGA